MNELKIKDYIKNTNFESVVKAIEENDSNMDEAESLLTDLLTVLETNEITKETIIDLLDLLYIVSLTHYAKGIQIGNRFSNTIRFE